MKKSSSPPSIDRLREAFIYDEDGYLRWRETGHIAGTSPGRIPYWRISLDYWQGYLHQAIFAYHKGYWPKEVDHDDRDKENNRIENLFDRPHQDNLNNRGPTVRNVTGVKGVFPSGKRFKAQRTINGRAQYLGTFNSIEEAASALCEKYDGLTPVSR